VRDLSEEPFDRHMVTRENRLEILLGQVKHKRLC
jgi:hypothetical protein